MIIFEKLFNIFINTILFFFIIYIYQESNHLITNKKRILLSSLLCALCIKISFIYFSCHIVYFGICMFVILSTTLYLLNFKHYIQIIYYSSFVIFLFFYNYTIIKLISFVEFLSFDKIINFYPISFSTYILSLFLTITSVCLLVYILKLKFLLPTDRINIFIFFSSILTLFMEFIFLNQFSDFSVWNLSHIIIYIMIGFICLNNHVIIQYLYNDFYELTIVSQNHFLSKITNSYIHKIRKEQNKIINIKHDIKNNIIILNQLLCDNNINEAIYFLKEFNHHLDTKNTDIYTGNIIIDAYFTHIISHSNISIQIKSNDLTNLNYKSDLISLIVNIVDNAVENAEKEVTINIDYQQNNSFLIKVANDSENNPTKNLKRTKKQGDHGHGLRIVHDIINKHSGTYITSYENQIFTTYILLELGGLYEN